MRYSQLLIPTVKEVPADAEVPSHRLMIRAGFVRKVASGTYTYLPLGWRVLRKIMQIVREEMDAAGAQEICVPILQPIELWQQTGREADYGPTMCKFTDRHGRVNALAPTAEEVFTTLVAAEVSSYKQLPINLYQINTKFRDEFRPRFGVLRSREFIMKDAYSFDVDAAGLDVAYGKMHDAYCRVFDRCGIDYVIVWAESGEMGGSGSQQFTVPCDSGEDTIVMTEDGQYAANLEKAPVDPPAAATPAADVPEMEEVHTPDVGSIEAVCAFLGTQPAEMIKTLIYTAGADQTVAVLIRGDHDANEEKITQAVGGKHVELADEATIRRVSGAEVGFAGPMGMAEQADVGLLLVDPSVAAMAVGVTGANKTDHHTRNVVPGRDFPLEGQNVKVVDVRQAVEGDTYGGKRLVFKRGIEVGQIFKLGTKYSVSLGATFLDESDHEKPCLTGSYGIGINRIFASAIELGHDDGGCILPINIAPFEVEILPLNSDSEAVVGEAERIYRELAEAGVDVLIDDREVRPGVKFKDADLIGIPLRIVVGDRGLKEGKVEIKRRTDAKPALVAAGEAVERAAAIVEQLKQGS